MLRMSYSVPSHRSRLRVVKPSRQRKVKTEVDSAFSAPKALYSRPPWSARAPHTVASVAKDCSAPPPAALAVTSGHLYLTLGERMLEGAVQRYPWPSTDA